MPFAFKHWLGALGFAALCVASPLVQADAPQSDNFDSGTLSAAWGDFLAFGNDVAHTAKVKTNALLLSGAGTQTANFNSAEFLPQSGITGNFDVRLRVISVPQCSARSEMGLMIRQDRNEDSTNWAQIGVTRSDGVEMSTGTDSLPTEDSNVGRTTPEWIRFASYSLSDTERLMQGYNSENADGPWHLLRSVRLQLADPVLVGPFLRTQCGDDADHTGLGSADDFVSATLPDGGIVFVHAVVRGQTDADGNPLPASNVWMSVQSGGKEIAGAATDNQGDAFIGGVPEGTVQVMPLSPTLEPLSVDSTSVKNTVSNVEMEVAPLPTIADLSANGTWELQIPAKDPNADPKEIATASSDDFIPVTVPQKWSSLTVTGVSGDPVPLLNSTDNLYGWYRTTVDLPGSLFDTTGAASGDLLLTGWNVDNQDWTYWNGTLIGATNDPEARRSYVVPASLLKPENSLVILAFNRFGEGGMTEAAPQILQANPTGRIEVTLVDDKGQPVSSTATVTATSQGNTSFGDQSLVTQSRGGQAVLSGLGTGTFNVAVINPDGTNGQTFENQTVTAGQTLALKAVVTGSTSGGTLGDLNGDGKVSIADATLSLQIVVGNITPSPAQQQAGDVTHDGKITVGDTTKLLQFVVGNITSL